ncbi:virion protein [Photobacterium makurazakiensis]|uniref:virion protein n=1 Tax=Photobacterium makurazakiensis TaxID=2910234 RepID=UPI003D143171
MKWLLALTIILLWLTSRNKQAATTKPSSGLSWNELTGMTNDMTTGQPRGIRNNNPLNIEYKASNKWRGQVGSDGRFSIFEDDKYGFRAAARVLRSYQKRGVNTIDSIVHTFAPSHENDSDHYANMVSQWTGYGKHQMLDAKNNDTVAVVIQAMARMEVGRQYPLSEVMEGVKLA